MRRSRFHSLNGNPIYSTTTRRVTSCEEVKSLEMLAAWSANGATCGLKNRKDLRVLSAQNAWHGSGPSVGRMWRVHRAVVGCLLTAPSLRPGR